MWLTIQAPFDKPHHCQVSATGKTLGDLLGTYAPQMSGCLVNSAFVEQWQEYTPQQSDRITLFCHTQELGTIATVIAYAAITAIVGTAVSVGLNYLMRAMMPTHEKDHGRPEQAFGISGTVLSGAYSDVVIHAGELLPLPPGMGPLLQRVLGLPFRLGAKHPNDGALDCAGLVQFLLAERWATELQSGQHTLTSVGHFAPVWAARDPQASPGGWRAVMRPWDVLCWQDRTANALLHDRGHVEKEWLHVALAVTNDVLVTSIIDGGVQLLGVGAIREGDDEEVLALARPQGLA